MKTKIFQLFLQSADIHQNKIWKNAISKGVMTSCGDYCIDTTLLSFDTLVFVRSCVALP